MYIYEITVLNANWKYVVMIYVYVSKCYWTTINANINAYKLTCNNQLPTPMDQAMN